MRVGYVRVSTVEQSEERQIIELKEKAGVEKFLGYFDIEKDNPLICFEKIKHKVHLFFSIRATICRR